MQGVSQLVRTQSLAFRNPLKSDRDKALTLELLAYETVLPMEVEQMCRPSELTMNEWGVLAAKDRATKLAVEANKMFARTIKTTEALLMLDMSPLYTQDMMEKMIKVDLLSSSRILTKCSCLDRIGGAHYSLRKPAHCTLEAAGRFEKSRLFAAMAKGTVLG